MPITTTFSVIPRQEGESLAVAEGHTIYVDSRHQGVRLPFPVSGSVHRISSELKPRIAGSRIMHYDLVGKTVFITGASSGIGRACAFAFHQSGAKVVAAARSRDKLETLADDIGDDRILPVVMDVTDADQRASALADARKRFGEIDVLINNAGWASFSSVRNMPEEHLTRMLALNFAAPVVMTQAVLPAMLERGSGQIVNISSVVGFQPMPRMTVYSATKAAINAFSTGLRMELRGTGVDVILLAPGSTNTPFFEVAASVDVKAVRLGQVQYTPERVARAVVRACKRRRAETVLTAAGRTIVNIRRVSRRLADTLIYHFSKRAMPPQKQ